MKEKGATLVELLEIAQGITVAPEDRNEAELYLDENKIEAGPNWVDIRLVYWHYLKWCSSINRLPISRLMFIRGMQKRHKRLTAMSNCFFKLDKAVFAVSKKEWQEVLQDYNIERRKKLWRKNIKKGHEKRRKRLKLEKREDQKRKKEQPEEVPLVIPDSKNNSSLK